MEASTANFEIFEDEDQQIVSCDKVLCRLKCNRRVRCGLDRFLRSYDTCCDLCRDSKGARHDPDCGEFNNPTSSTSREMRDSVISELSSSTLVVNRINEVLESNPKFQGSLSLEAAKCLAVMICSSNGLPILDDKRLALIFSRFAVDGTIASNRTEGFLYSILRKIQKMIQTVQCQAPLPRYFFVIKNSKVTKYYKFKSVLGQGSFGVVHRVIHIASGQERVCKSIAKGGSSVPAQQIESEIRIIAQLDHPHVIRMYEYFEDEHHVHLIMEHCGGGDLMRRIKQAIKSKSRLPIDFIRSVLRQLLSALAFMRSHRIIHKDLKPENIMLMSPGVDGEHCVVKVIDFGLSELFRPDQESSTTVAGTAFYMAPEIFRPPFNHKCDVWSCGVITFFLLSGFLPYFGATVAEVKSNVLYRRLQWPNTFAGSNCSLDIPDDAKDLVERMLDRDAKSRPDASQALHHSWLNESPRHAGTAGFSRAVTLNVIHYGKMSVLKRATLNLIAHIWNFAECDSIRCVFTEMDAEHRGFLTVSQLASSLARYSSSSIQAWKAASAVDVGGTGSISYTALTAAVIFPLLDSDKRILSSAYESFGMSRKGFISARGMWEMFVGGKTAFPRMKQGMEYPAFLELVKNEMKLADSVAVSANSFQREGKLGSSTLGVDECSISFDIFKNWLLSTD